MHYLEDQRLVMPGYSSMQDTIGQALTHEQERLQRSYPSISAVRIKSISINS